MNLNVRGSNIMITESLRLFVEKKMQKLEKYFESDYNQEVNVTLKVYKKEQKVEVTIPTSQFVLRAEVSHEDMYAAVDLVVEKLVRQIRKYKTKSSRVRRHIVDPVLEGMPPGHERFESQDESIQLVRRKRFNLKPMDVEEAVMQMDMLGHNFFVYSDVLGGNTNVVYKRRDGKYGLIISE